jgi:hypothetical protein
MTDEHTPARRGRQPRETVEERVLEAVDQRPEELGERRRDRFMNVSRDPSLRRFGMADDLLDQDKFIYRSAADVGTRLLSLTEQDDYDFVSVKGNKLNSKDGDGAAKFQSGTNIDGSPQYTYLLRKLRTFADSDRRDKDARNHAVEAKRLEQTPPDMANEQSYTPTR